MRSGEDEKDADECDFPRNVVYPVAVEAIATNYILKTPDGRIIIPEDQEFETEALAVQALQRRRESAKA